MKQIVVSLLLQAWKLAVLYYGFVESNEFALNVLVFLVWLEAVLSPLTLCDEVVRKQKDRPFLNAGHWLAVCIDIVTTVVLVGSSYPLTGIAQLFALIVSQLHMELVGKARTA